MESAGVHQCSLIFVTRQGYWTAPDLRDPIDAWTPYCLRLRSNQKQQSATEGSRNSAPMFSAGPGLTGTHHKSIAQ
jgi:hypothetical protein